MQEKEKQPIIKQEGQEKQKKDLKLERELLIEIDQKFGHLAESH